MLKASAVAGLPVIGMEEAKTIGRVMGVLLDSSTLRAACFIVQKGPIILGAHALALEQITGIGPDAVAVSSGAHLVPIAGDPALVAVVEREAEIPGAQVYKINGERVGTAADWSLTADGRIAGVLLADGTAIAGKDVVSVGRGMLVVRLAEKGNPEELGFASAHEMPTLDKGVVDPEWLKAAVKAHVPDDVPVKAMRRASEPEEAEKPGETTVETSAATAVETLPLETPSPEPPPLETPPKTEKQQGVPALGGVPLYAESGEAGRVKVKGVDSPYASVVEVNNSESKSTGIPIVVRRPNAEREQRAPVPLFPTENAKPRAKR